jgi:hypothetical protein
MRYRFMPIIMLMFCTLVGAAPAAAQAPSDVRDLVGVRASFGERQLKSREYRFRHTETGRDRKWTFWWKSSIRQCISVVTLDGQFDSIVASPPADCDRQGGRDDDSDYDNGSDGSNNNGGGLQVTSADWGWGNRRMDVTNRVQSLLSGNGVVTVNVQNMGGDPSRGDDKVLRITARDANGQTQQFTYKEGSSIDASLFGNSGRQGSGRYRPGRGNRGGGTGSYSQIQIVRASYGSNRRTNDVTQRLTDLVGGNNSLSVQATNINLGGDPDRGKDKILTVTYRANGGAEQTVTVKEGNTLRIP